MWIAFAFVALGVAAQAPGGSARARLAEGGRAVELSAAGGLSLDLKRQVGVARRDVVIHRDDVTVCCDEAEARYAQSRIERVTCKGRVVIVRPDGTRAAADMAVFVAADDEVTLEGRAELWTADARLSGKKIIYDLGADRLEVIGGESRLRYEPKQLAQAPASRACPPVPRAEQREKP